MFNLTVDAAHTFYVGERGWLVHNCEPFLPIAGMKGKVIGHTFTKHGSQNTAQLLRQAEGSGMAQGQWIDDAAAEAFIAQNLPLLRQGARDIRLPPGMGRMINPDGTFVDATWARLVPSGSGVKTAFPIYPALPAPR